MFLDIGLIPSTSGFHTTFIIAILVVVALSLLYYDSGFSARVRDEFRGLLWFVPILVPFERIEGSRFKVRVPSLTTNRQLGWPIFLASTPRFRKAVSFIWHLSFYCMFYIIDIVVLRLIVGLPNRFVVFITL